MASDPSVERVSQVEAQYVGAVKRGTGGLKESLGKLRPELTVYEARVTHDLGVEGRRSVDSGNSRRMIIKKGVEWSVDYDMRNASSGGKEDETCTAVKETRDGR